MSETNHLFTFGGSTFLANDSDPDNTTGSLTVQILSNSPGTMVTDHGDGTITFDPGAQSGLQQVTYQLVDANGLTSNVATVSIMVAPNTPPTGADGSAVRSGVPVALTSISGKVAQPWPGCSVQRASAVGTDRAGGAARRRGPCRWRRS